MRNASTNLEAELARRFPCVEIFGPLVREAISMANMRNDTPAMLLDDTGLVRQFVSATHVCRRSCQVDSFDWDYIGDGVLNCFRSIWARFEENHDN